MLKRYKVKKGSLAWWIGQLLPWMVLVLFLLVLGWIGRQELIVYCERHYLPLP